MSTIVWVILSIIAFFFKWFFLLNL
jgi:hypothetical protein